MAEQASSSGGDLIVAADFGTSAVKVGVVDGSFQLLARTVVAYPLSLPGVGRAEQDPHDWWNALGRGVRILSGQVEGLSKRAAALVFCAQMCGLICAADDGAPLRPAMIWLDKRSAGLTRELMGGFPSIQGYGLAQLIRWVRLANGAPSLNGMDATGKMAWIARNEPDVFERTAKLLDVKDWLLHRATGRFCTTPDSGNLTWLMDTRSGREGWAADLANRIGIPLSKLSEIVDGREVVGGLTSLAANELGLPPGLSVVAGAGDVTATAIGSGAVEDGALHICASTGGWISGFFPSRRLNPFHAYATITSSIGYRPLLIAAQETAGSAFTWIARLLCQDREIDNVALAALYANPGSPADDDPFFLPWLAGERVPVDDDRLRGTFHGLSLRHDRDAILRAVVEGVALNMRWAYVKVAEERSVRLDGSVPLVGGVALNPFFVQTLADSLNRALVVRDPQYSGVLGSAAIAAGALGWSDTVWDAAAIIARRPSVAYEPSLAGVSRLADRNRQIQRLRRPMLRLSKSTNKRAGPVR